MTDAVEYRDLTPFGFPGYRVGNDGSVWTCLARHYPKGESGGGVKYVIGDMWKRMKLRRVKGGYLAIQLRRAGSGHHRFIHRIVLEGFVGPCPEGMEGAHDDGNPANNNLSNLRWATKPDNQADRVKHGTDSRGEKHGNHKLTAADVVQILDEWANGWTLTAIASARGLDRRSVGRIVRRRSWRHLQASNTQA